MQQRIAKSDAPLTGISAGWARKAEISIILILLLTFIKHNIIINDIGLLEA
jgi:hypothetical protein